MDEFKTPGEKIQNLKFLIYVFSPLQITTGFLTVWLQFNKHR